MTGPRRLPPPWTFEEDLILWNDTLACVRRKVTAAKLPGRSMISIYRHVAQLGLYMRERREVRRQQIAAAWSDRSRSTAEIAAELGTTADSLRALAAHYRCGPRHPKEKGSSP